MDLEDCYSLLGLQWGADIKEIKASYRRLARRYHPDVNPTNKMAAQAGFIRLNEAYQCLLAVSSLPAAPPPNSPPPPVSSPPTPSVSEQEKRLKSDVFVRLQDLLKKRRFARAIALVEGLAIRLPQDPEVRQWQAIAYQVWGRHLIRQGQYTKATLYLKKALRTDPHNRVLVAEIAEEFRRLEQLVSS